MIKIKIVSALVVFLAFLNHASYGQEKGFTLTGTITDENGNPMEGVAVSIVNTYMGTFSGFNGRYSLKADTAGTYELKFSCTGYDPVIKKISVPSVLSVDVTLVPRFTRTEEVIVSATRAGERTPVTYSGISGEDIIRNNLGQDLPFLIGMTPSLVETSEAGTGIGYTGFRIRGTDASRINITLDGIPLNDAESQQVFWVDLPDLASSVDNIQVQRGVGTSSNGAGAFGASVNLQTESPENLPFAELNTTAGSFKTLKNTVIAGTGLVSGKFALQMRYSDIRSDGYIKRTGTNNRSIYFSGIYKTDRSLLKLNVIRGEEHTGISWWGVPADILPVDRRYNPAGQYTDESGKIRFYDNETDNYIQDHYQLIYSLDISKYLNFHAALHYTHGTGYYEEYAEDQPYSEYGLPPVVTDTVHINSTDLIRRKWLKNDFYGVVYSLSFKKNRIDALIGGSANNYSGKHYGQIIWMRNAGHTEKDYQWYFNTGNKGEFNIYGRINYRITDRLSGYGDLQYRHISYRMKGPDDDLRDLAQSHYYDFVNPKAGIFFSATPRQDLYLSFSVAHKEPTRADFKEAAGDPKATPRAETLFDTEAGYLLKTGRGNFGANLYGMFYKDQLVPTGQLSNVGYPIMTNVPDSYRTGIELTADLKPFRRLEWILTATLSRNRILRFTEYYTEYTTDSTLYSGRYLGTTSISYSPDITGSSDIAFKFSGQFDIHLVSKYVGRQYFDNTMSRNRMISPYFFNNLHLDYIPKVKKIRSLEVRLTVNNILNNLYVSNAYGGFWYEDGTEKNWAYYFPQAGINFLLAVGLKF